MPRPRVFRAGAAVYPSKIHVKPLSKIVGHLHSRTVPVLRQKPQRFKFIVEAVKLPAKNFFVVLLFHVSDHTAAGGHCASQRRWDAAVTCAQLAVILNGLLGRTLSSLDDLQLGMPIFDDNRDAQV